MERQRQRLAFGGHEHRNASRHPEQEDSRDAFPPRIYGRNTALPMPWPWLTHTDCGLLAFRTVREYTSAFGSHWVWGNVLQQPQETNTRAEVTVNKHQTKTETAGMLQIKLCKMSRYVIIFILLQDNDEHYIHLWVCVCIYAFVCTTYMHVFAYVS